MRTTGAGIGVLLAAALVVGGCHSTYHDLKPVEQPPEYAARASACAELPHEEGRTVVARRPDGDLELAWCETRAAHSDWLIVALHGVLSTHRNWQGFAGELGPSHDLLLLTCSDAGTARSPTPMTSPRGPAALRARHAWCWKSPGRDSKHRTARAFCCWDTRLDAW